MKQEHEHVVDKWIGKLENELKVKQRREQIKQAFEQEFGITPDTVTSESAETEILLNQSDSERVRDCMRVCQHTNADADYYSILFSAFFIDLKESFDWKLDDEFVKYSNGILYKVFFIPKYDC